MKELVLFEIPIYSMKREDFIDKVNEYHKERIWKYNQIIGYIEISYSRDTVWFELYYTDKKKIYVPSNRKVYIIKQGINGYHFMVKEKYCNEEIRKMVHLIIEENINKNRYIDLEVFNNTYKNINYINIFRNNG